MLNQLKSLGLSLLTIFLFWGLSSWSVDNELVLPHPSSVLSSFVSQTEMYLAPLLMTLSQAILGWVISVILGTLLSILALYFSSLLDNVSVLANGFPRELLIPSLLLSFSVVQTQLIIVCLITTPIYYLAVASALRDVAPAEVELIATWRGHSGRLRTFLTELIYLRLPSAVESISSALKASVSLSIIAACVAEMVASSSSMGVGLMISNASAKLETHLIYGAALLLALSGLFISLIIEAIYLKFFQKLNRDFNEEKGSTK